MLELVELLDGPVGQGASGVFAEAADAARAVLAGATVAEVAEAEARAAGRRCTTSDPLYAQMTPGGGRQSVGSICGGRR